MPALTSTRQNRGRDNNECNLQPSACVTLRCKSTPLSILLLTRGRAFVACRWAKVNTAGRRTTLVTPSRLKRRSMSVCLDHVAIEVQKEGAPAQRPPTYNVAERAAAITIRPDYDGLITHADDVHPFADTIWRDYLLG
ncbi:unnamed protein product, partial [Iphiclides podalirius]